MRQIRMLRAMRRELETGLRRLLHGHAGGNPGHSQGVAYELPRQFPTLPASAPTWTARRLRAGRRSRRRPAETDRRAHRCRIEAPPRAAPAPCHRRRRETVGRGEGWRHGSPARSHLVRSPVRLEQYRSWKRGDAAEGASHRGDRRTDPVERVDVERRVGLVYRKCAGERNAPRSPSASVADIACRNCRRVKVTCMIPFAGAGARRRRTRRLS